ncbi:MAG: Tfp pilus assembly protein major pilin PilA [Ramlibacter sp.]|nr:Tfp pilus assembly protein major pilin PilA [Ramlibacter sp.]
MSEVILASSACRTTITEVYQSGSQSTVTANNCGCEATSTAPSKYVNKIITDGDGKITVTASNIGAGIDGNVVTLTPADSAGAAMVYAGTAQAINRWICGSQLQGTTIEAKFLPGSCRG